MWSSLVNLSIILQKVSPGLSSAYRPVSAVVPVYSSMSSRGVKRKQVDEKIESSSQSSTSSKVSSKSQPSDKAETNRHARQQSKSKSGESDQRQSKSKQKEPKVPKSTSHESKVPKSTSHEVKVAKSTLHEPKVAKPKSGVRVSKEPKSKALESQVSESNKHVLPECDGITIERRADDTLVFDDFADFRPNLTPRQVLEMGSFGGTYFRPIKSSVTGESYTDVWKELPSDWLASLKVSRQVASSIYDESVNKFGVKCGGSLQMWEESGWIAKQDPYGWFQWYCRFYLGRRSADDERQMGRWQRCAGVKGRWRNNLITKVVRSGSRYDDSCVSPVVRQTLQHWAYQLTEADYRLGADRVQQQQQQRRK